MVDLAYVRKLVSALPAIGATSEQYVAVLIEVAGHIAFEDGGSFTIDDGAVSTWVYNRRVWLSPNGAGGIEEESMREMYEHHGFYEVLGMMLCHM